jgi:hypothetical protein
VAVPDRTCTSKFGWVARAPVLTGRVLASSAVHVVAAGVSTLSWQVWLQLDSALAYLLVPPAPFDEDGNFLGEDWRDPAYEAEVEQTRREMLAEAPGGVLGARSAIAWARDGGLVPDTIEAVAGILDGRQTFAEDQFLRVTSGPGAQSPIASEVLILRRPPRRLAAGHGVVEPMATGAGDTSVCRKGDVPR